MSQKFYLTTPIYYVNARPHIGHAYTTIVADVLARRHRLLGDDTWFLTGTDEHGQKIERSAAAAGVPPQQFADEVSASFKNLWDRMGLTYDQYIRTTDEAHKRGVQKLFTTLQQNGQIYLDSYTGAYCVSDEAFVDVPAGTPCPDCGRITEIITEENYFFRLSEYQLPLLNLIESNELVIEPEARRNEVLSFLRGPMTPLLDKFMAERVKEGKELPGVYRSEDITAALVAGRLTGEVRLSSMGFEYFPDALRDLSISRSSFTWGIPVPKASPVEAAGFSPLNQPEQKEGFSPGNPAQDHVIYVWLDALANYMTAVGYGDDTPEGRAKFARYWPADLHIVGKEIIRFHCVYWPAFLLAAGEKLPKKVVAHGWLLFDDSKMSKSKGNIVRTETILDAFGPLCPVPPPADPPQRSVILSGAKDPCISPESATSSGLSFRSEAEGSASSATSSSASKGQVLISPAAIDSALKGRGFSPAASAPPNEAALAAEGMFEDDPNIAPQDASLKSTASAVPSSSPNDAAALAAEANLADDPERKGVPSGVPQTASRISGGLQAPESDVNENGALAPATVKHHQDLFAADILRYFLLREIPFGQDGSFSFDALITRYNADLANGYGNLVSRTLTMIDRYSSGSVPDLGNRSRTSRHVTSISEGDSVTHVWQGPEPGYFPMDYTVVDQTGKATHPIQKNVLLKEAFSDLIEAGRFSKALEVLWESIRSSDLDMSLTKPWILAKDANAETQAELASFLSWHAASIRELTALVNPFLPYATANVWRQLGLGNIEQAATNGELKNLQWGGLKPGTKLGHLSPIFPRADKGLAQTMANMETPKDLTAITDNNDATTPASDDLPTAPIASETPKSKLVDESFVQSPTPADTFDPAAGPRTTTLAEPSPGSQVAGSTAHTTERPDTPPHTEAASGIFAGEQNRAPFMAESHPAMSGSTSESRPADASPQITIDDFAKIELRVAKIVVAERIPKADKLLRLEVDLGYETRQILSGIAEHYTPEELIGRRIVVITNLAPRKMRGLDSHGMLLAASAEGGKPILATFPEAEELPLGSRLK